jgi:hypothetical protein
VKLAQRGHTSGISFIYYEDAEMTKMFFLEDTNKTPHG